MGVGWVPGDARCQGGVVPRLTWCGSVQGGASGLMRVKLVC